MVTSIVGSGTAETSWRPFLDELRMPLLDIASTPPHVVVVAPHPDDEVLGAGGLMALCSAGGARVDVVAVTDGEASHPGGSVIPRDLAQRRVAETDEALTALGVPAVVRRLRLPDGGSDLLEEPVVAALHVEPGSWLIGPWAGDGHPDHEAVGRACRRVAQRDGARLLSYPVWAWHWAELGDPRLPWERARRVELSSDLRVAKARAVDAFATQIRPLGPSDADAPVLTPSVLDRFARGFEVVFV